MWRRLFLTITLALLFSLGQQGSIAHGIAHLTEQQETQHKGQPHQKACDKCVVCHSLAGTIWTAVPARATFHYSARAPPFSL